MASKKAPVVTRIKRAQLSSLLSKGKRLDDRGLLDYRQISVEIGVIEKASGSAIVKIGNTKVIAGVKVQLDKPFEDTPDKGLLIVTAEVLPIASPYAEPGPPDEDAVELARVVDRGIRESGMIDVSKLCLVPGKKVLAVFVDISVLNVEGNLFDATSYAAVTALSLSTMPKYEIVEGDTVKDTGEKVPLPITNLPISVTMALLENNLVVDPSLDEESIMNARITFSSSDSNTLCAAQKGRPGGFSVEQIKLAASTALSKGEEIRQILRRCVENGTK